MRLVDLKTGESTVLAEGRDFYTSPRLDADSTKVTSWCIAACRSSSGCLSSVIKACIAASASCSFSRRT